MSLDWGKSSLWDDWKDQKTAYYLILTDIAGKEITHGETLPSPNRSIPYRVVSTKLPPGDYLLRVMKQPETPNLPFDIFFSGLQAQQVVSNGSLLVPQDAKSVVTVGGAVWNNDAIRLDASQGPTRDGRVKPDLVAPECVSSQVAAGARDRTNYFSHTSRTCGIASAGHVAGAAALYKQAHPDATPDDILAYFQQNAKKLDGADGDPNVSGAGRLQLGPPPA